MALLLGLCRIQVKDLALDIRFVRRARKTKHRAQALQDMRAILDLAGDAEAPKHSVPVIVFTDQLDSVLTHSNCTLSDLVQARNPMLSPPHKLLCLHGWKRINAAMTKDPHMWWSVRLYSIPPGIDPYRVLRPEIEDDSYETPWSHGEVMLKVLRAHPSGQDVNKLVLKLRSQATRKALKILLKQPHSFPIHTLQNFPGLWAGLELGNIERHLSLHSTDEMRYCIQRIRTKWRRYTFGDPQVEEAVDEVTVEEVEQRSPACPADRAHIRELMASGALLASIRDPERRQKFERELLKEKMFIPSIKALHENLKYLSVAIWIIKRHLLSGLGAESVFGAMQALWQNPQHCVLEFDEGDFRELPCPASPYVSYMGVVITSLRYSPWLSDFRPRWKGEKAMDIQSDPRYLHCFLRSVQEIGYNSPKIEATVSKLGEEIEIFEACPTPKEPTINRSYVEIQDALIGRRWGKPKATSFQSAQKHLFLPKLFYYRPDTPYPTSTFVFKDFFFSFFDVQQLSNVLETPRAATVQTVLRGRSPVRPDNARTPPSPASFGDVSSGMSPLSAPQSQSSPQPSPQSSPRTCSPVPSGSLDTVNPRVTIETSSQPDLSQALDTFNPRATVETCSQPASQAFNPRVTVGTSSQPASHWSQDTFNPRATVETCSQPNLNFGSTDTRSSHMNSNSSLSITNVRHTIETCSQPTLSRPISPPLGARGITSLQPAYCSGSIDSTLSLREIMPSQAQSLDRRDTVQTCSQPASSFQGTPTSISSQAASQSGRSVLPPRLDSVRHDSAPRPGIFVDIDTLRRLIGET